MTTNASAALRNRHATWRGIALAVLATVMYAVVDIASKYLARDYPIGMIVWARYTVPLVLLAAIFLPRRGGSLFRTALPFAQLVRGVLLTTGTVCILLAYRVMPIAEAQAISFIHPVLLTLLAVAFLGEKVTPAGWVAVLLGFAGILIIVRPGGGLFTPAALLPLGLALCYSSYQMLTRIISVREDSINSLIWALMVGSVLASLLVPFVWVAPTPQGIVLLGTIGILSGIGHFSTIKALQYAPASLLAPFAYVQLVWITILGILVFAEYPDALTVVGMAIVVAGGLLVAASHRAAGKSGSA